MAKDKLSHGVAYIKVEQCEIRQVQLNVHGNLHYLENQYPATIIITEPHHERTFHNCATGSDSNKLPHDKTNKMTCAPSKDSDQPGISLRCPHEESLDP